MNAWALVLALAVVACPTEPAASPEPDFSAFFSGRCLRLDTWHCGDAQQEKVVFDRFVHDGPWAGTRKNLVDSRDLGKYRLEVAAAADGRLLFRRGYSSIFGEWETTRPALDGEWRVFHESARFPEPLVPAVIRLFKRDRRGRFQPLFTRSFKPGRTRVEDPPRGGAAERIALGPLGEPARKVDLLVMGDGYVAGERDTFLDDARRLIRRLFATSPFRERKADFNVRALVPASPVSGITDPRRKIWRGNALGCRFDALGLDRYILTFENRRVREAAAGVPYDFLIVLCHSSKYGGGGIFNLYSTCSAGSPLAPYVFVHEFGHAFAGLGDEYYSSNVSYADLGAPDVEPWEPNLTRLLEPGTLKWGDLLSKGTPLPTPWDQAGYDALARRCDERRAALEKEGAPAAALEAMTREKARLLSAFLEGQPFRGRVGAFEGAGYAARGLFRPELNCLMFSRHASSFCRVCRRAILRAIDQEVLQ